MSATQSPASTRDLPAATVTPIGEIEALVARARKVQPAWEALSPYERIKAIAPLKKRILQNAERIAKLVASEVGKPEVEAMLAEAIPSADVVAHWCEHSEELLFPEEIALDPLSYPGKSGVTSRVARGVVLAIMPWNFPIALPLRTLVPALIAGNAVVFKPSEVTPRSGALIAELFEGLLPKDLLVVVQGDGSAGAKLLECDVDVVVFTGSVATGRKVAHACAERLLPSALELGGKDAAIVLEDADLERAAQGIVWAAFSNAGQNCGAVERVYVMQKVAQAFTDRVVAITKALPDADVGPLTTAAQAAIVARHVAEAVEKGAEILAGGAATTGNGYAPTVLAVKDENCALMKDETFGPVLPIVVIASAEEGVRLANATRYGLTASVWSKNVKRAGELALGLRAGVITLNNHAFTGALPMTPWSGVGETGWGITNSHHALDMLTRPQLVLVDRNRAKRELWWYPYTPALAAIASALAKLKGGAGVFGRIGALFTLLKNLPQRFRGV